MGFGEREIKLEASVALSSRADIRVLASLNKYWEGAGVYSRSMSQLVAWSLELLLDIIEDNKKVVRIESVADAEQMLSSRSLMQRKMYGQGRGRRLDLAKGFENLRADGVDPADYSGDAHRTMHGRDRNAAPAPDGDMVASTTHGWTKDKIKAEMIKFGLDPNTGEPVTKIVPMPKFEVDEEGVIIRPKGPSSLTSGPVYADDTDVQAKVVEEKKETRGRKKKVVDDDAPRQMNAEELDQLEHDRARKDKERKEEEDRAMKEMLESVREGGKDE